MNHLIRLQIRVEGIVQGVGFRPYVHALATRLRLAGHVGNDPTGVFVEVEGAGPVVAEFLAALPREAPPLARVESVDSSPREPTGQAGFTIAPSTTGGARDTLVSADSATCDDCLRELRDPADRRHRYPFVNCTNCGPRYTIVRDVPYDRPHTTMAGFPLCDACAAEYHDPSDRRFHAQPVCCPACGPTLRLLGGPVDGGFRASVAGGSGEPGVDAMTAAGRAGEHGTDPVTAAAALLRDGGVLAVKGLGGYHLAVVADHVDATRALRERKHREEKPFAIMVADLDQARALCEVDATAAALLTSRRRPVVLLPRLPGAAVAPAVAPGNRDLGLMLPYTPLHHLLLEAVGRPIVLTSGNVSDEPIAYRDDDAGTRLAGIADAYLTHDRPIHIRTDDSVTRSFRGAELPVRRSRGYAPEPLRLRWPFPRPVLACGAELKNTVCLARGSHAFVSQHIGDLENAATLLSFRHTIEHLGRLFDIRPEVVGHDLHPEYLSTKHAMELDGVDLVGVQHHHAHIASCLADNGHPGPVIGVAFDGLGYGADSTIWGGEFLIADLLGYHRAAHLAPVPMPGGTAAIRQPWRMAAAYLDAAAHGPAAAAAALARRHGERWDAVVGMARRGVNAPLTSSAGRLFDAVAALLGVRDTVSYEGQAAIELEQLADPAERGTYPVTIQPGEPAVLLGTDVVRHVLDDLAAGQPPATVAGRFHNTMAAAVVAVCAQLRDAGAPGTVALSGGVFQNILLLGRCVDGLTAAGFDVLIHHRVPPNDGGISLGQAAVVGALDRARPGS